MINSKRNSVDNYNSPSKLQKLTIDSGGRCTSINLSEPTQHVTTNSTKDDCSNLDSAIDNENELLIENKCDNVNILDDNKENAVKSDLFILDQRKTLKINDGISLFDRLNNLFSNSVDEIINLHDKPILRIKKHFQVDSELFDNVWNENKITFKNQMNQKFKDYVLKTNLSENLRTFEETIKNGPKDEQLMLSTPCKLSMDESTDLPKIFNNLNDSIQSLKTEIELKMVSICNKRIELDEKSKRLARLVRDLEKVSEDFEKNTSM